MKTNIIKTDEYPEVTAETEEVPVAAVFTDDMEAHDTKQKEELEEYIKSTRMETAEKIEQLLNEAREHGARIILEAREELEEERKRGFKEGFEEGSVEGKRTYDEKLKDKIREDDKALKHVLNEIYREQELMRGEMEEEVVNLALDIVKKIINPTQEAISDIFLLLIKNALRQTPVDGKIVIRVGPVEYERFFSSGAATIELDSGITVNASVIRDISLNEGDCIIDTDDVTINAGIESQLQFVKLAFERANQYEPD